MFTRLPKGLVLKSGTYENGETFYTIILKNRFFFLELYKTVKLSKNWEDDSSKLEVKIKKYDFTNYLKKIVDGDLRYPEDKEEIARLRESIENLPEKTQRKIYGRDKLEIIANIKLFPNSNYSPSYEFEIQRINNINNKTESNIESFSKELSDKFYKKALSITSLLHL